MGNGAKVLIILLLSFLALGTLFVHCARHEEGEKFTIVIRMMDIQDKWFRENIVKPFEKKYNVDITVAVFDKMWDVPKMLQLDARKAMPTINLVKTPKELMIYLKEKELVQSYEEIVPADELKRAVGEYDVMALKILGFIDGRLYFMPRKSETRMMIYLKSKVKDAVRDWTEFKDEINQVLKVDNGYGLPAEYQLESNPDRWDTYDLFVAAYYWANREYFGMKMPRMAHRGKKYMGTVVGLTDKAVQMGASEEDLLRLDSTPVVDMLQWEAIYRKNGLYNSGMWEESWSGGGIWGAMRDGKVFLAFMHQIDCFFIHGGAHPAMAGFLADPDDLAYVVMPSGVSFDLDKNGRPLRTGTRKAMSVGWGWSVPRSAPDPDLAWKLVREITNYENHLAECKTFGMYPVRKDILAALSKAFPESWMVEMFDTSFKQMEINAGFTPPQVVEWPEVGKVYLDAWYDLTVDKGYESTAAPKKVDRNRIATVLKEKYVPRVKGILK